MKNPMTTSQIFRPTWMVLSLFISLLAGHALALPPSNPSAVPLPEVGFASNERALVIILTAPGAGSLEFVDAILSETPPGATFAAPAQLGVVALDGEGKALFVRNAPSPRWVYIQDENGNESKVEVDGETGFVTMPFDPAIRAVRIDDLDTETPLLAEDITPSLVRFCTDGDITDQEYCQQFPCYNDPSLPGCQDTSDACPADPFKTEPGLCGCGTPDDDADLDGTVDCNDSCPADPLKIDPGSCGCGTPDDDADGDGVADCIDQCPADPLKDVPGICGCGTSDADGDGDGVADCVDFCPADPFKDEPQSCGCGVAETDGDLDGTPDCLDACPVDANKTAPGACGCGVADNDSDSDGVPNCNDNCPDVSNADQRDSNNDEVGDACTEAPPAGEMPLDVTGDGKINGVDFWAMILATGKCSGDPGFNPRADFTGDACVTRADFRDWFKRFLRYLASR